MLLRTVAVLLAMCLGLLGAYATENGVGAYMYGSVTQNNTNYIVQLNPLLQNGSIVFNTQIPLFVNTMAFDTARDQLIFMGRNSTPPTWDFYVLDLPTKTMGYIAPWKPVGAAAGVVNTSLPAAAAYYDNAFWFVPDLTAAVVRVAFEYTNGIPTNVSSVSKFNFSSNTPSAYQSDIAIDVVNKQLYLCLGNMFRVDLSNLDIPLPVTFIGSGPQRFQCAFDAEYETLWGTFNRTYFTVNTTTAARTLVWTSDRFNPSDLGGSSFFGFEGAGECFTQYVSIKTKAPKSVKRARHLRYRAYLKGSNKALATVDGLALAVELPPQVTVVTSGSSLEKWHGVVGTAGPSSVTWVNFTLPKRKTARFDIKMRISSAATKGQTLTLNTTLYHLRSGIVVCPRTSSLQVRVR